MLRVFEACKPRQEVTEGALVEDIFAAELDPVVAGTAPDVYLKADLFFANTFPTDGLQTLVRQVFQRLAGKGGNPLIRLETSFGGGKTHGLITLYHLCRSQEVAPAGLLDAKRMPKDQVLVAGLSGRDFGVEGRDHGGTHVNTLWGEVAWQLRQEAGYALVADADRQGYAPSGDTLGQLVGDDPVLIMLDELGLYMRKAMARKLAGKGTLADQVPAFLQSLAAAASTHARAVVVITLAGEHDAYTEENEKLRKELDSVAAVVQEAQAVVARQELVIQPTGDEEVASVVVRRLFESVDHTAGDEVARAFHDAYGTMVSKQSADLPERCVRPDYRQEIARTYPFHPELLRVLMTKTATIPRFQRTRGALRVLARVVRSMWAQRPEDAYLIQPCDLDFGDDQTRDELTSRLDRAELVPVIRADVFDDAGNAHAQQLDRAWVERHKPPLTSRLAKLVFLHSLTSGKAGRAEVGDIMLGVAQPDIDSELLREALGQLADRCWFLHGDEGAYWFTSEASPNKVIDDQLDQVTAADARKECYNRLQAIYQGTTLQLVPFPERPADVDDDADRLRLCLMHFDLVSLRPGEPTPKPVKQIYGHTGAQERFRQHGNAIFFLLADTGQVEHMLKEARYYLALQHVRNTPSQMDQLSEKNQDVIRQRAGAHELTLRVAITRAYRHLLIPNPDASSDDSGLQMVTLDVEKAAKVENDKKPGKPGQEQVILEALVDAGKLMRQDAPSPLLVVEYAWPKGQQTLSTEELWRIFRRNGRLPVLMDRHQLRETVRSGTDQAKWAYFDGDRVWTKQSGTPQAIDIRIDPQHELWAVKEVAARGYCAKCGVNPCACQGPKPTCPKCKAPREDCKCVPCMTCNGKPWECHCGQKPPDFQSERKAPNMAFQALRDWAEERKVEQIEWLEVSSFNRPGDLQQLWTGMQYFVPPQNLDVQFEASAEISQMQQNADENEMQRDTLTLQFDGSGASFRRVYDFFHGLAQSAGTEPTFAARFKATPVKPLAANAGEIADLRDRLANGGVQQVEVRAGAAKKTQ